MKKCLFASIAAFLLMLPGMLSGQTEGDILREQRDSLLDLDDWMVDPALFNEHSSSELKVEAWMLGKDEEAEELEVKDWMLECVGKDEEGQAQLRYWMLRGLERGVKR
ncbi:MAG TPA: hypothetical protein GXZ39_12895 [Bacteroidales bacterium]|nr:hypothetical protein [Bacteroidales bacterium]